MEHHTRMKWATHAVTLKMPIYLLFIWSYVSVCWKLYVWKHSLKWWRPMVTGWKLHPTIFCWIQCFFELETRRFQDRFALLKVRLLAQHSIMGQGGYRTWFVLLFLSIHADSKIKGLLEIIDFWILNLELFSKMI